MSITLGGIPQYLCGQHRHAGEAMVRFIVTLKGKNKGSSQSFRFRRFYNSISEGVSSGFDTISNADLSKYVADMIAHS